MTHPLVVASDARLDSTGRYRYSLSRAWNDQGKVCWIMLNPSTADATQDDPTIRRCMGFAASWGYGGIVVVNLFALRATDPGELERQGGVVGPENDRTIIMEARAAGRVMAAWGAHGTLFSRSRKVVTMLRDAGVMLHHLGQTSTGEPRHPLYVKGDTLPVPWLWP